MTEKERGYQKALIRIQQGVNVQQLYNDSANALNQDAFDKGWQKACIENGANYE